MNFQQIITKYPIGAQIVLKDDDKNDEPHEVVGYKKIKDDYYLLFKDGGMVVAERRIMNIQNAIEHLDDILSKNDKWVGCEECKQEHVQLREWLNELQQYRAIGTVDACKVARERMKPKKPV